MSDNMIAINNLSKKYRIGAKQLTNKTFREAFVELITTPLRNFMALRKLSRFNVNKKTEPVDVLWALKDVSFSVQPGEVVGIIGRNGAGKTTLLKILSRITDPTSGAVEMKKKASSLLEVGTGFHPELTGRENIFLNGAILGMRRSEIKNKFNEIVDFSGVEKFIDTPVKRYSSGMYVRLAFSVASHLEPEILIVDEVLAVGDVEFQKKCLNRMQDVSRTGRTILFVSHNMYAIKALCSRCILLEKGRLVADGPPQEVVNQYLSAGFISKAQRLWGDPHQAPNNNVVRWVGAAVRNERGEISADLETDTSFTIELEYDNLIDGSRLGATVALFNEDDIEVLTSISNHCPEWHNKQRPQGSYRSICTIPGKLLSEGKYKITFVTWADNYSSIKREDNVLEVQIHDSGFVRRDYLGRSGGIIKPLLQWKTNKINN